MLAVLWAGAAGAAEDVLVADFEGEDYGPWRVEGAAFGDGPAHGTLPQQMSVTGFLGSGLVNSYKGGDGSVGRLISPPFILERDYVNFLIGGGKHPGETCMNLLVDGYVYHTATGPNDRPGGSERLDWATWDVSALRGRTAVVEIVDTHRSGWGHINVDHIVQSDRAKVEPPRLLFPNSDFEQGTLEHWTAEGEAFTIQPTKGDNPKARERQDHARPQGAYWIGTFERYNGREGEPGAARGDGPVGTLTSVPFEIRWPYINCLIGSGRLLGQVGVELLIDGQPQYRATGFNSETMWPVSFDVAKLMGKMAVIRIFDQATGNWGHVNADNFTGSRQPVSDVVVPNLDDIREFAMRLRVQGRYLNLPVKNGAEKVIFELRRGEEVVREFDIELGVAGEPDWWAFYDISMFRGEDLELRVREPVLKDVADRLARLVEQSDEIKGAENLYHEARRPQFHYTSRRGWNNDPNGLVYYGGEYHLFYQHNPFGIGWGNMHWGHAVSRDLVHWEELPIALYQRGLGDMAYSGGGNVDVHNTSGWKTGAEDILFVSFTSTGRGECIAYSDNRGRSFREYEGNPVLKHQGRDPKIIWYDPDHKWVMIVYDEAASEWRYALYESRDLKTWSFMSVVPEFYECPDLFRLPLGGDAGKMKWVVYGAHRREADGQQHVARSSYQVGSLDGHTFTPETPILNGHLGPNYYAAQSFSNAPNGRGIMICWLAGATYSGMPFSQGFTVPLELSLRSTPDGPRLFFYPVKELEALRVRGKMGEDLSVVQAKALLGEVDAELLDIVLEIWPEGGDVILDVRGVPVTYYAGEGRIEFQGCSGPVALQNGRLRLRVLVDRGVVEVFGNDGQVAFSAGGDLFDAETHGVSLSGGGNAHVARIEAHELGGIWP